MNLKNKYYTSWGGTSFPEPKILIIEWPNSYEHDNKEFLRITSRANGLYLFYKLFLIFCVTHSSDWQCFVLFCFVFLNFSSLGCCRENFICVTEEAFDSRIFSIVSFYFFTDSFVASYYFPSLNEDKRGDDVNKDCCCEGNSGISMVKIFTLNDMSHQLFANPVFITLHP